MKNKKEIKITFTSKQLKILIDSMKSQLEMFKDENKYNQYNIDLSLKYFKETYNQKDTEEILAVLEE